MRKRISFCNAYRQMMMFTWDDIIFTDEMRLKLYGSRQHMSAEELAHVSAMITFAKRQNFLVSHYYYEKIENQTVVGSC